LEIHLFLEHAPQLLLLSMAAEIVPPSTDKQAAEASSVLEPPVVRPDPRTTDGKSLYIHITLLEPEVVEKDGEKFMVYPVSTEVCH